MLSGSTPPEDTGAPTGWGTPLKPSRRHRYLVAAGIDREQVAPVTGELDRALGGQAGAEPGAADRKGRAGDRRERPVGVPVEAGHGVRYRGVVVDVGVPDDRGFMVAKFAPLMGTGGCRGRPGQSQRERDDETRQLHR